MKTDSMLTFDSTVTEIIYIYELEGKYSLESTDPRESEIRAHLRPQFSVE